LTCKPAEKQQSFVIDSHVPRSFAGNFSVCRRSRICSGLNPVFQPHGVGTAIATLEPITASQRQTIFKREPMLKITRAENGEVIFTVSGRMDAENLDELKKLFIAEARGRRISLDLKELTLVDQDAVTFLERCEADNIQLKNCSAYIREWITRERGQK
jgi:hypothetical protein